MKYFSFVCAFVFTFFGSSLAKTVCYDNVGCFSDDDPFDHFPLPQDPNDKIAPTYYLHQLGKSVRIIENSNELGSESIFLVHGYTESYDHSMGEWAGEMIEKLHQVQPNADIVFVDWKRGAMPGTGLRIYLQAASNTRAIGAAMAHFIKSGGHTDLSKFHCIGFSLGAQVCGFAGKNMSPKWGRISALEPARPAFSNEKDPSTRVDKTDGDHVDILHTSKVGTQFAHGHQDFWVNDVRSQPGCDEADGIIDSIEEFFSCSHKRAPLLFTQTINPPSDCNFQFCPCGSWLQVQLGFCKTCASSAGAMVGYSSIQSSNRGEFYGSTTGQSPYCLRK